MNKALNGPAIRVNHLSYRYGTQPALVDLNFELGAGKFLALLGPNGAGKTTLFALLTRLLQPDSGDIALFGQSLSRSPASLLSRLGVVFQSSTLDLDLTVAQNLFYHGALHGMNHRHTRERMEVELARFNLLDHMKTRVRALNGGHRRRVELARALLHGPRLLLLDEPTVGLDVESRHALNTHVRTLCEAEGIAALWTTHIIEELDARDHLIILNKGKIEARGACDELVRENGARNLQSLFLQLTGEPA